MTECFHRIHFSFFELNRFLERVDDNKLVHLKILKSGILIKRSGLSFEDAWKPNISVMLIKG